jgi:ADP-ribose pyrophosphatase
MERLSQELSQEMSDPVVIHRRRTVLSPWVTLVERGVTTPENPGEPQLFHSLEQADYVTVLAVTAAREVILVEQFRPALERRTIELPGGLLDAGEEPAACAVRELAEETGFAAPASAVPLGCFIADTGRLENRIWGFLVRGARPIEGWRAEPGVAPRLVPEPELKDMVKRGEFDNALHVAIIGMALLRGEL